MHGRRERDRETRSGRAAGALDRRRFLAGLAASGAGLVAGCYDEYRNEDVMWPDDTGDAWRTSFYGELDEVDPVRPQRRIQMLAFDVGFVPAPDADEPVFVLAEDVEETATRVSMTLKPDLAWSNGDPLTAAGVGRWIYMYRMGSPVFAPVPDVRDGNRTPRSAWEAITDVEWDDRTITLEGEFDRGPSPLSELNAHLGSHPRRYHDELWEAFQDAFDDAPWEDESTWERVTSLVEENIWRPGPEYRPAGGINFEANSDGRGLEAAFSGLWYPYRVTDDYVFFAVNDAHPFADRVSFDEIVWAFRGDQDATIIDLRRGAIDGAALRDATENVVESTPSHIDSFEGPPQGVVALTVNHVRRHLWERDVRAALMYAIDRDRLVDSLNMVTRRPVEIPGADLQSERWAPPELRDALRSYEYDPDRARELLEGAGFRESSDGWKTPDGEQFELELLTSDEAPTLHQAIVGQLEELGIEANPHAIAGTSYQTQLEDGLFLATDTTHSSPNVAGKPATRTGTYVRSIVSGDGFPDSAYLEREVDAAVERNDDLRWVDREGRNLGVYDHQYLEFDSPEALRSITVEAPPYGEPDGAVRDWPYLYHAFRARVGTDVDEKIEHARRCTWIYNYQVPELELLVEIPRIFHDTDEWTVPGAGDPAWHHVGTGTQPSHLWAALALGHIDRSG